MDYYIRLRGHKQGPFTADQLQRLAARGHFSRHYEVSTDGHTWKLAEHYPHLFPAPPPPRQQPVVVNQPTLAPVEAAVPRMEPAIPLPKPELQAFVVKEAEGSGAEQWYFTHNGAELGPVGTAELKRRIGLGQVIADDHVWIDGMEYWQRVRDVPELARLALSAGPAAAVPQITVEAPLISGLAVASFVLGLLGATLVPCLGSILAVVFGHVALAHIRQSAGKLSGKGLAVTGLVFGYLVIIPSVVVVIVYVTVLALSPTSVKLSH